MIFCELGDIIIILSIWSSTQAGRRGVTRNLVGHESAARVRIPAAPPIEKAPARVLFLWRRCGIRKGDPGKARVNKCPVDTYLARGRIPAFRGAVRRTVNRKAEVIAVAQKHTCSHNGGMHTCIPHSCKVGMISVFMHIETAPSLHFMDE